VYFGFFRGRDFVVTLTQGQIQECLDPAFPITRTHLRIFSVTYSSPRITLLEATDRIRVEADAVLNVTLAGQTTPLGGTVAVTTGLRYDDPRNAFYVEDPVLDALRIQGVPTAHVRTANWFLEEALCDALEQMPVYDLNRSSAGHAGARLILRNVEVHDGKLLITLGV